MFNKLWIKILSSTTILILAAVISTVFFTSKEVEKNLLKTAEKEIQQNLENLDFITNSLVMQQVQTGMRVLKSETLLLGIPKVNGTSEFLGKSIPNLKFGNVSMVKNYEVVDKVKSLVGGTATIFLKNGAEFLRITTNVQKDDGNRAIGTILNPNGKAIKNINKNPAGGGAETLLRFSKYT